MKDSQRNYLCWVFLFLEAFSVFASVPVSSSVAVASSSLSMALFFPCACDDAGVIVCSGLEVEALFVAAVNARVIRLLLDDTLLDGAGLYLGGTL